MAMFESMRTVIELFPGSEYCAGLELAGATSVLTAGFDMGIASFFGLGFGVGFFALGLAGFFDLRNASSSGVSASFRERRLTTGHLLHELLHFVRGEEGRCAHF